MCNVFMLIRSDPSSIQTVCSKCSVIISHHIFVQRASKAKRTSLTKQIQFGFLILVSSTNLELRCMSTCLMQTSKVSFATGLKSPFHFVVTLCKILARETLLLLCNPPPPPPPHSQSFFFLLKGWFEFHTKQMISKYVRWNTSRLGFSTLSVQHFQSVTLKMWNAPQNLKTNLTWTALILLASLTYI